MASTMRKNALSGGLYAGVTQSALELWFPPEDADGICTSQTVAAGTLNLNGAFLRSYVTNGKGVLPRALCPTFTFSESATIVDGTITGADQWGRDVSWNFQKGNGTTLMKTLATAGARIPPLTRIDEIRIRAISGTPGTVEVGVSYASGNSQSVALPMSFEDTAAFGPTTKGVYIADLDGYWSNASVGDFPTMVTTNTDLRRGVIGLTIGTTTQNVTALTALTGLVQTNATWTDGTKTLTKVGAFTAYEFVAGDTITVSAGTGVTTGVYQIASRTDNDSIVLVGDITGGGGSPTDVSFKIDKFALFKTSAFTRLTVSPGDTISITGGTGIVAGSYPIKYKSSSNTLELYTNPGIGASNPTDVTITIVKQPTKWSRMYLVVDPVALYDQ